MIRARRAALTLGLAIALCLGGDIAAADSAAEAAARRAQAQHGGRVLKVERKGDHYRVKLLQESGKVKVVTVPTKDESSDGDEDATKRERDERKRGSDRPDERH